MNVKKIRIRPLALVFIAGMILCDRGGVTAITLLAAAVHECGHLLAARAFRVPLRELRFDLLGARIEVAGRMISYGEEWLLAAAGPAASLVASAAAAMVWRILPVSVTFSCVSLILGLLNLLPITGFDGGRMLSCTLCTACSPRIAARVLQVTSLSSGFLLWATAVYFLLRRGDGLSLFFFSMSLLSRFFEETGT